MVLWKTALTSYLNMVRQYSIEWNIEIWHIKQCILYLADQYWQNIWADNFDISYFHLGHFLLAKSGKL